MLHFLPSKCRNDSFVFYLIFSTPLFGPCWCFFHAPFCYCLHTDSSFFWSLLSYTTCIIVWNTPSCSIYHSKFYIITEQKKRAHSRVPEKIGLLWYITMYVHTYGTYKVTLFILSAVQLSCVGAISSLPLVQRTYIH